MQPASHRRITSTQYLKVVLDIATKRGFRIYAAENSKYREDFRWSGREIGAPLVEAWHDRACEIALEGSDGWIFLQSSFPGPTARIHMLHVRGLAEVEDSVTAVVAGYPPEFAEIIRLSALRTEGPVDAATGGEDAAR